MEDASQFNEDFIKNNEENDEGYFLELDIQYPEKMHELHNDLSFLPKKKRKLKKSKSLLLIYMIKLNMFFTWEI